MFGFVPLHRWLVFAMDKLEGYSDPWLEHFVLVRLNHLFFPLVKFILDLGSGAGERSLCTPQSNLSKQYKIIHELSWLNVCQSTRKYVFS